MRRTPITRRALAACALFAAGLAAGLLLSRGNAPSARATAQVVNGFSDLMVEVFGEKAGKGARSAVGMASLPGGIPIEVEAVFEVRR